MTSTFTTTRTITFTNTATHLAGVAVSALAETLLTIGVSVEKISTLYQDEQAIAAWIEEQSLQRLEVTLTPPGGQELAGYSVELDYTAWDAEQQFRDQLARIRRQAAKEPRVKTGTSFALVAKPRPGWSLSSQPGWGSVGRELPSFANGYRHGTVGSGPGASAVFRSHRH